MANKKEPVAWITVKGVRVPIFEGQSKEDAFKSFKERIGKRNSNQPMTQKGKANAKKEYTNARNAAHNAKPDKQEKAGERFEKAKQKYSESKEKTAIKSVQVKGDREARTGVYNEQLKEVQDDIRQAESTPVRLRSGDYDKKLAELKQKEAELKGYIKRDSVGKKEQSQAQKNIAKNEDEKEKQIARNEAERRALTKHEKLVAQMRDDKRRREQGIKTKYGAQDHTKLDQHPDIKKMAEDFNKDVWTREGGVRNGELYDKAKAWAKEHNYNEEKAVKAAMKARDDDYVKTHQRINEMSNKKYGKNYSDLEDSQRKEIAKSAYGVKTTSERQTSGKSGTSLTSESTSSKSMSQKYQGSLSKMNTNQLRDLAVELGADRKKLYGTSKNALISVISNLKKK